MAASAGANLGITPGILPNETLDQAIDLGHVITGTTLQQIGSIGGGPDGAADVEWYSFTLDGPARVTGSILRQDPSSPFNGVLSLFNNDPNDWGDPYNGDGSRLLEQVDGKAEGGVASFNQLLGPGTYFLAVSGDGNFDFHPFLAGSGLPGSTGGFYMRLSVADAGLASAIGPQVLTSSLAPGALSASPLAIRVDLSGPLDPYTVIPGVTAQLIFSPTGAFNLDGQQVPLASTNFSTAVENPPTLVGPAGSDTQYQGLNELQLFPASPLAPGYYEVLLTGLNDGSAPALLDAYDVNGLGADAAHPLGQDITIPFQVDGINGVVGATGSDDTPATAQELGNVTGAGLVRVAGAIGTDPFYNGINAPDPSNPYPAYVPADQVDMYHFRISGPGSYAFVADVFAGRIGSPLDPGISLFELDPVTRTLTFVAGDNNTYDATMPTQGFMPPLYTDAALQVSLTAGDYYLAVANGYNTYAPAEGSPQGSPGLFDPNVPDSGTAAYLNPATGPYVLDLIVRPPLNPPHVQATSPAYRDTLTQPLAQLTVRFDEPVNIAQLAMETYGVTSQDAVSAIYIEAADGTTYTPRFVSYDSQAHEATFEMLDGLPDGRYSLHISGQVTNLGGTPLVGNDPSGDYVVPFTIAAAPRGSGGNPRQWIDQEPNDDIQHPQDLGILFPNELSAGVTVTRDFSQDPAQAPRDTADVYEFQVLLGRTYTFGFTGKLPPTGVTLSLTDLSGQVLIPSLNHGRYVQGQLAPGTYLLKVSGWDEAHAAGISYTVAMHFITVNDNAPPLLAGPAPAVAILLDTAAPPTSVSSPPPVEPPPVTPPPVAPPVTTPTPTGSTLDGPPPSSGTEPSADAGSPGALAIAIPAQFQGGPTSAAASPLGLAALGTSSIGGVVGTEGYLTGSTELVQYNAAPAPSWLATGLIVLGTSLPLLGHGEEIAAAPNGPEEPEGPTTDIGDRGPRATPPQEAAMPGQGQEGGVRLLLPLTPVLSPLLRGDAPAPRGEAPDGRAPRQMERAAVGEARGEAGAGAPRPEVAAESPEELGRSNGERTRVFILGFTGLALGAYAHSRRLAGRNGRREEGLRCARPALLRRRPVHGVGLGRIEA